jgi:DNA-binding NarL/FixJ family response regulator
MVGAHSNHATSPRMFGRESESARLAQTFAGLHEGRGGLVVISGEAGIGKTRLINEALDTAGDEVRVLRADCLALGSGIPYLPFAELLRDLVRQLPAGRLAHILGPARNDLARVLPEVALVLHDEEREAATSSRVRSDELERLRLYEAFLSVTERIALDLPTVFVIEDVQWIDRASLELLAFLAHGISRNGRTVLIASVRPEEVEDNEHVLTLLAELGRVPASERFELGPLTEASTHHIARALLDGGPDDGLIEHVQALSDGNPLFAEELLLARVRRGPDAPLPPKLRDLLAARLMQVPADVLEVLRVAAAAGRAIDDQLIARASDLDEEQVQRAVRAAVDDYILISSDGAQRPGYRFRHEILRALVASQLLPAEARRIHAAYARALSDEPAERRSPIEIADHWDAAGETSRALVAHIEAGRAAAPSFAFELASQHYERALELWAVTDQPEAISGSTRAELLGDAASTAARAGSFDRAIARTHELIDGRAELDEDTWQLARSSLRWYLWEAGDLEAAVAEAETVIAEGEQVPARWRANALGHAAALLLYLQRTDEAAIRGAEALALAEAANAHEEQVLAEGVLGWCRLLEGQVDEGLAGIRRAVDAAQATHGVHLEGRYPVGAALAHAQLAAALELAGRLEDACETAMAGIAVAVSQGVARTFGSVLEAAAARALYQLGRWAEADEVVRDALQAGAVGSGRVSLLATAALLATRRGRDDEAEAALHEAEALVAERTPVDVRRWLTAAGAELDVWRGDAVGVLMRLAFLAAEPDARTVALPGTQPAMLDASIPYLLALGARACADVALHERAGDGDAELSRAAEQQLRSAMERAEARASLAQVWAGDLALAHAELARGSDESPKARVKRWETALERVGHRPYAEAYAGWRLAQSQLSRRDGRASAVPVIEAALETSRALGATPLTDELTDLARRARLAIHVTGAEAEARVEDGERPYGLTARESEVLGLVAAGMSNAEIAERLFISPKTASVHVSNIYGKLGVESRVAAATRARELGLDVDPDATEA